MTGLNSPPIGGELLTFAFLLGVAVFIINKRVKPE
jgi:hypothetical protein